MESNTQFWINPFRTGPSDPDYEYNIDITVYSPEESGSRTQTYSFTVNLTSRDVAVDDVVLYGTGLVCELDNSYDKTDYEAVYVLTDRNYGCDEHWQTYGTEIKAGYCSTLPWFNENVDTERSYSRIWIGTKQSLAKPATTGAAVYLTRKEAIITIPNDQITELTRESRKHSGWLYTSDDVDFTPPKYDAVWRNLISKYMVFSKTRCFVVSQWDKKADSGNLLPVCCWLLYDTNTAPDMIGDQAILDEVYTIRGKCMYTLSDRFFDIRNGARSGHPAADLSYMEITDTEPFYYFSQTTHPTGAPSLTKGAWYSVTRMIRPIGKVDKLKLDDVLRELYGLPAGTQPVRVNP